MMAVSTSRSRGLTRASDIFPALPMARAQHIPEPRTGPKANHLITSGHPDHGKWIQCSCLSVRSTNRHCQVVLSAQIAANRDRASWLVVVCLLYTSDAADEED